MVGCGSVARWRDPAFRSDAILPRQYVAARGKVAISLALTLFPINFVYASGRAVLIHA